MFRDGISSIDRSPTAVTRLKKEKSGFGYGRLLATYSLLIASVMAQAQSWQKFSTFQNVGGASDETARQMVVDGTGNIFTLSSSGSGLVLAKRDSGGVALWRSFYPAEGSGLSLTTDGGVAVVGRIDRGNNPSAREILTLKYDANGVLTWTRVLPGATGQPDPAIRVKAANDGSIYVGATVNQDAFSDISVIKYSSAGDFLWKQTEGPDPNQEVCLGLAIDPAGNVLAYANRNPAGTGSAVIYKFAPAGNLIWEFSPSTKGPIGGFAMDSTGASYLPLNGLTPAVVKVSAAGTQSFKTSLAVTNAPLNIALLGTNAYVCGFQPTTTNCFVTKLNTNGSVAWTATHTGPASAIETLNSIGVAADGSSYSSGNRPSATTAGIFTLKVSPTGVVSWAVDHGAYTYTPPLIPPLTPTPPPPIPTTIAINGASQPITFSTIGGPGTPTGYDTEVCVDTIAGAVAALNTDDQNGTVDTVDTSLTDGIGRTYVLSDSQQGNGADVALEQVSSTGVVNWVRAFGGPGNDLGYAIAREPDGGVAVGYGVFNSGTNLWDTRVRRFDAAGNVMWTVQVAGSAHIASMACASDGAVYLTGQDQAVLPFRYRTAKLNGADGTVVWNTLFTGLANGGDDFPFKISLDNAGRVYVCGNLWDGSRYLATLQRYDPTNGNVVWTQTYASSPVGASAFALVTDGAGGAYIAGADWANGGRGLIRHYDSAGTLLLNRVISETDTLQERFVSIALDGSGNVIVGGSAVRLDKNIDLLAAKYAANGALLWKDLYDGPAGLNDIGKYLAVDKAGHIFVAGSVTGGVTGRDYVLWRLNADGSAGWPDAGDGFVHSSVLFDSGLGVADSVAGLGLDDIGGAYLAGTAIGPNNTYDMHVMKFAADVSSQFISQTTPATMVAGQTYFVSLVFQNTSNTTWTAAGGFGIGTLNPVDNMTWSVNRVPLGASDSIAPGGTAKVQVHLWAPTVPGTYNFQWSMRQEPLGVFGTPSTNIPVVVSVAPNAARYVTQNPPSSVKVNASFTVKITMRNVGSNAWTTAGAYAIAPSGSPTTWNITQVSVGTSVAPGADKVFTLSCKAPPAAGSYVFRFQMRNSSGFFGDQTATKTITVTP